MMAGMDAGVEHEVLCRGSRFDFVRVRERLAGGGEVVREMVRHPGAVVIVAVTGEGEVVVIRNRRVAVGSEVVELPAGTRESGEDPAVTASRELLEETGYRAGRVEALGRFWTTPGLTDELMLAYVASDLEFVGQRLESGERITAELVAAGRVWEMVDCGELMDGKSIAALTLAQRKGWLS